MTSAAERVEALLERARADDDILAFWLGGSRGKGQATEHSDYDCMLIVRDEALTRFQAMSLGGDGLDLLVMTLGQFEALAAWGGPHAWMRYAFVDLTPLVDKTGRIPALMAEKAQVPAEALAAFVDASLDRFTNQVYRALKCLRDGDPIAARLESAEAPAPLLDALFAVNGRRLRPYAKHLTRELAARPLAASPWPGETLPALMAELAGTEDAGVLRTVFNDAEPFFRARGHAAVFEAWGEALPLLRG